MLKINNKLKALLITLIVSSNSLFSTNQEISENKNKKLKTDKPVITRDMAINIGQFLPGDNKFLNELVRLYPAEEVTYKNIAQRLVEKNIYNLTEKDISEFLEKHFKTSRLNHLQSNLKQNIKKVMLDNYLLITDKQKDYLESFINSSEYIKKGYKYLQNKKNIIDVNNYILKHIKYLLHHNELQNLSLQEAKEKLTHWKEVCKKVQENFTSIINSENSMRNIINWSPDKLDREIIAHLDEVGIKSYMATYIAPYLTILNFTLDLNLFNYILLTAYIGVSILSINNFVKMAKTVRQNTILKLNQQAQEIRIYASSLENDIERKIRNLDNINS